MTSVPDANFDEMVDGQGNVRSAYAGYREWYDGQDPHWLRSQNARAESFFGRTGITFNVYGEADGEEKRKPIVTPVQM